MLGKNRLAAIAAACALGLFGLTSARQAPTPAQQPNEVNLVSKDGSLKIEHARSFSIELIPGANKANYIFRSFPNRKITGQWREQGASANNTFEVSTSSIDGVFAFPSPGSYRVETAVFTGGVEAEITRPTAAAGSSGTQTATVNAAAVDYTAAKNLLEIKGGIRVVNTDEPAHQTLQASGSSGTIILSDPQSRGRAISRATIQGPIDMRLTGRTEVSEDGRNVMKPFFITGKADKMVYTDSDRTIILDGNVKLDSNHPAIPSTVTAPRATITLTAEGEVKRIEMGGPGQTVIRDPGGTGGGGKRLS